MGFSEHMTCLYKEETRKQKHYGQGQIGNTTAEMKLKGGVLCFFFPFLGIQDMLVTKT